MPSNASSRYTVVPNNLEKLLTQIPSLGTPEKANSTWLGTIGMRGGNDRSMLRVLKALGAVAPDGTPTDLWKALRAKDRPKVGAAIKAMYADLWSVYPDADQKDTEALTSFFRSTTELGDEAQKLSVRTFKVLCGFGDFAAGPVDANEVPNTADTGSVGRAGQRDPVLQRTPGNGPTGAGVALTVNIQLQLPPSTDGEVYDKLFAAMATHLRELVVPE
jgi:hypothetical protein